MAFHGHTKIELHNVKTDENKVIEKHNIFTNYIHDIMQIIPLPKPINWNNCAKNSYRYGAVEWGNHNGDKTNYPRPVDVLCGGILCLENEHTESADNYFLTTDDIVTARGSCIANASEDTQLGSYNVTLEQSSHTSKTMVWDFSQTQGNGTISTIGLTNIGMALCGLGDFPPTMKHTVSNPFGDVILAKTHIARVLGLYDDDYPTTDKCTVSPLYMSIEKQKFVSFCGFTKQTGILELRYYDLNTNEINPMNPDGTYYTTNAPCIRKAMGKGEQTRYSPTKRITFDLSSYSFSNAKYMTACVAEDGILYITFKTDYVWGINETIKFVKIDLLGQKIIGTCQMTNTSNEKLRLHSFSDFRKSSSSSSSSTGTIFGRCWIMNDHLFLPSDGTGKTFSINVNNSTDVKEILTESGESVSMDTIVMEFADGLMMGDGNTSGKSTDSVFYIDVRKGIAKHIRTGSSIHNEYWLNQDMKATEEYYPKMIRCDNKLINLWVSGLSTSGHVGKEETWDIFATYKQDALSTINVLDEPVIKTADMTMRITYTISLEEDEE